MKISVTGANGFIGTHLVSEFAARGHSVVAAARSRPNNLPLGVLWVPAPSLGPAADFDAVVADCDIVIHAAARVHVMNENADKPLAEFRKANVGGTAALARAASSSGVRLFVFLSSIKVNGEETRSGFRFTNADAPAPQDPYAVSKAEAEKALFEIAAETGLAVVIVRPALVYGPGVKGNFRTIMKAIARGLPLPFGGITNQRSMIYVRNLVDLIYQITEHRGAIDMVLLASDGQDLSTTQLLRLIGDYVQRPARLLAVPDFIQRLVVAKLGHNALVRRLFGSLQIDNSATCNALEWSPPFTIAEGMAATTAEFRNNSRR